MISKLKILGLTVFAIAATSAIAASVAQAGEFDVGVQPSTITGHIEQNQEHVLTLEDTEEDPFNSICTSATLEATTQGQQGIKEVTATATYSGCKLFGTNAQVRMNGCKYTLTGSETDGTAHPANTATVDITGCTAAAPYIQIKSLTCELRIPEQHHLSHVVGQNILGTNPHEVTLKATVSEITVTQVGAACPDGNNHHSKNASFTGSTIVKAYNDTGTSQVTAHGHQYTQHNDGQQQVSLTST